MPLTTRDKSFQLLSSCRLWLYQGRRCDDAATVDQLCLCDLCKLSSIQGNGSLLTTTTHDSVIDGDGGGRRWEGSSSLDGFSYRVVAQERMPCVQYLDPFYCPARSECFLPFAFTMMLVGALLIRSVKIIKSFIIDSCQCNNSTSQLVWGWNLK